MQLELSESMFVRAELEKIIWFGHLYFGGALG